MRLELSEEALILRTHIKKLRELMSLLTKASEAVDELLISDEVVTSEDLETIQETNDIINEQLDHENGSSMGIAVKKLAEVMTVDQ